MTQAIKAAREEMPARFGEGEVGLAKFAIHWFDKHYNTIHALLTAAEKVDFEALGRAISVVSYMTDEHDTHEQVLLKAATALHEAMKG